MGENQGAERQGALLVVIDGPAGAGKSTAARRLADRLEAFYLDTGAMYRACTLRAIQLGVDLSDGPALAAVVDQAQVELLPDGPQGRCRVLLEGEDVSESIRTREVTNSIHHLANEPLVRERLVAQQQALAEAWTGTIVAEGRDLGSVVFPQAQVKVYLDATVSERARRRLQDLDPSSASAPSLEELEQEIAARDHRDMSRAIGPLTRVPDAHYLDSSKLSADQVVDALAALATAAG